MGDHLALMAEQSQTYVLLMTYIIALAKKKEEPFKLVNQLDKASTTCGMEISAEKTKLMTDNTRGISSDIRIGDQNLETVQSFKYLGSVMTDEGSKQEIINVQDCPNSWCTVKTQDRMERQEHCPQLQNQNDVLLCHFNLTVRVLNMHPCSTVREEDTRYRNEMLPKACRHPLQGSCYEWRSEEHYHSCYLVV